MSTSSDEDDELDAAKFASVAIDSSAVIQNASTPVTSLRKSGRGRGPDEEEGKVHSSGLKLYQTRLQDLLYKHLDKTFGDEPCPIPPPPRNEIVDESARTGGIRLFRRAPPGIVVPLRVEKIQEPRIKPQLRPSLTLGEDSDEHLIRLQATVVDGETVAAQAEQLRTRALASGKASQAKAESEREKEDVRVAELRRRRGEAWLPRVAVQIAKEMAQVRRLPTPVIVLQPEETTAVASPRKKKRKKKVSKAQLGVVVD